MVAPRELCGAQWLIVGFGSIGELVADRAVGFGCEVTGLRRMPSDHPSAKVASINTLFDELPSADVVVLAALLNESTKDIADEKFFSAMKPGSLLVNVGRGALVDDDALLAALETKAPEFAVLDVFREEPLPSDHPFWDQSNLFITGHISAWGDRIGERSVAEFVENLPRFIAGEPLRKEVVKTCDN